LDYLNLLKSLSEADMFAVIKTGGKQYKVAKDDKIAVETLAGEPGDMLEINNVLMIGGSDNAPTVGTPALDKAAVFAEVVEQTRSAKVLVFKKKRRQNYRRKHGHRQNLTILRIAEISPTGTKPKAAAKPKADAKPAAAEEKPKVKAKTKAAAKTAAKKPAAKKPAVKKSEE
jgi:large subunit ribosomal protein L21